ncbi:MAG: hypothetical protein R3F27_08500 [Gammaproteobacteria bacterium]
MTHPTIASLSIAFLAGLSAATIQAATLGEADGYSATSAHAAYRPYPGASEIQDSHSHESPPAEASAATGIVSVSNSSAALEGSPFTTTQSVGSGSASAGLMGVHASVAVSTSGGYLNSGHGNAETTVSWWDGVVINKVGLTGQSGYLTASLRLDGNLFVQAADQTAHNLERAFATLSVRGEGLAPMGPGASSAGQCLYGAAYCAYAFAGTSNASGAPANGYYEFGALSLLVPFTFGQEFYLGYTLTAKAFAQAISWDDQAVAGAATGLANYAHTLSWDGISGVFRSGGTPVVDFDLESGSGIDYRLATASAVPLPATHFMLLTGLSALGAWRRWRRR